ATATFMTVKADALVHTSVVPLDGETVGVGLPIAVNFSAPVAAKYRAAVERRLQVTSHPAVVGSWHWMSNRLVRYRPKVFWPAHAHVTLKIGLAGVKAGPGTYGAEDRSIHFTVGRSMVSKVSVTAHTMSVYQDGRLVRVVPISTGK